jgi:hypothetical protein
MQLVAFGCHLERRLPLQISERYRQVAWLPIDALPLPNLAPGSEGAIHAWVSHPARGASADTD